MRIPGTMAVLAVTLASVAPNVHAGTLTAGPVEVENGGHLVCLISNISDKDIKDLQVTRALDNVVTSDGATLAAGTSVDRDNLNQAGSVEIGWCRFKFKGSKRKVLASACARPSGGGPCIEPVPAQ